MSSAPARAHSGPSGSVLVYYAADDDRNTAEDLAVELRKAINDPRYACSDAQDVAGRRRRRRGATTAHLGSRRWPRPWREARDRGCPVTYGRRVVFTPTVEPRVTSSAVDRDHAGKDVRAGRCHRRRGRHDRLPRRRTIRQSPRSWPRSCARRSRTKYQVRTVRATTGRGKEGQIEYDNERMAGMAQVLAGDAAAWISRAYGRRVRAAANTERQDRQQRGRSLAAEPVKQPHSTKARDACAPNPATSQSGSAAASIARASANSLAVATIFLKTFAR